MYHYRVIFFVCALLLINVKLQSHQQLITFRNDSVYNPVKRHDIQKMHDQVIVSKEIDIATNIFINNDTVAIQLDGEHIVVIKNNSVRDQSIDYIYNAYKSNHANVFISKLGNDIQGIIHSLSGTYVIYTDTDKYILNKINLDEIPEEAESIFFDDESSLPILREENVDTAYLRILVMYTPEALLLAPNMINKIFLDINNGNLSFINSDIKAKFELAYIGQTINSEAGYNFDTLLSKFRTNGDGVFDEVHLLRDRYSADVCVLIVHDNTYCGLGYVYATPSYAFVAVRGSDGCASKYSFTHEIGHNIGCRHDTVNSPTNYPFPYGHGYVNYSPGDIGGSWRTMMSYGNMCGGENFCTRVPYWSNPNIYYNGVPMGNTTHCNNARVWNENSINVSNFRTESVNLTVTHTDQSPAMNYAHWRALQAIVVDSGYVVDSGQIVKVSAANSIILRPGTKIKAGAKFYATVDMAYSSIYPHFIIAATSNSQINDSQNEATKQLLGTWQVYRERVTGIMWGDEGMPYTGSYTHDVNTQMHIMFTPDYEYEIYLDEASEVVYYSDNRPYTIEPQAGDTWLLTISGAFDMPKPSDSAISGRSPITIYKLTENEMEWEYTYYGGDEGPVTYYQYVRRYISNEQGTENVSSSSSVRKILCNSQILILRGNKTYTLTGQVVR